MFKTLLFLCIAAAGVSPALAQSSSTPERVSPTVATLALVIDGKPTDVVAHIYKPHGEGPFPLVIHSHGRSGSAFERHKLEYPVPVGHANYWLQKGVALVSPVRPGYGQTGGADVESSGANWQGSNCYSNPDFERTAVNARRTVVATYQWAVQQAWVRKDRILIQGQSVGGLTSVATAALNLPGVVATVNFAGGREGTQRCPPVPVASPGT